MARTKKADFPKISDNPDIQARYEEMRASGESHNIAEMAALRTPCGTRGTERALFSRAWNHNLEGLTPDHMQWKLKKAREQGVNPTGKIYLPELARQGVQNDPIAWVGDISDVKRACEIKGVGAPQFGIKEPNYKPRKPKPKLAEPLVRELMTNELLAMPKAEAKKVDKRELREKIIEKHGAKKVDD